MKKHHRHPSGKAKNYGDTKYGRRRKNASLFIMHSKIAVLADVAKLKVNQICGTKAATQEEKLNKGLAIAQAIVNFDAAKAKILLESLK